jgi:hypothetical protein
MAAQQQKNYLFVSNHCQHSKRLMMQLQKSALMNSFQLVNIDDPRVQLPQFVQCVPTLYIPSKRHVLTDADLFQWFQNEFENETKNAGKINMADITGDANILPFLTSEMGSGLSGAAYSFLEDDKNELMNQNYSFLQDRDINKMPDFTRHDAPSSFSNGGGGSGNKGTGMQQRKTGGSTDQAYDMMMKSRGAEMQNRAPPQTPNFSSPY